MAKPWTLIPATKEDADTIASIMADALRDSQAEDITHEDPDE
jgi:hypothetical protein